jgi:large subunit ribosomal protein L13
MKTLSAKKGEVQRDWYYVDAKGKTLGRLAADIAKVLRGKHKPNYTPHIDCGDFVIVLNAEHIQVSGRKLEQKTYARHSGYPGGFRSVVLKDLLAKHPIRVLEKAVKGMLPHNRLGRKMYTKLNVYAGEKHPHAAQQPKEFPFYRTGGQQL